MGKHQTRLRAKYQNDRGHAPLRKPLSTDQQAWDLFNAHVVEGQTLQEISSRTGYSCAYIRQLITRVDHDLELPRNGTSPPADLGPASPVEDLALSTRARHALHLLGCQTVEDALRYDFSQPLPRLGRKTRHEILTALVEHHFITASQSPDPEAVEQLNRTLTRLRHDVDNKMRRWQEQLVTLEDKLRKLSGPQ